MNSISTLMSIIMSKNLGIWKLCKWRTCPFGLEMIVSLILIVPTTKLKYFVSSLGALCKPSTAIVSNVTRAVSLNKSDVSQNIIFIRGIVRSHNVPPPCHNVTTLTALWEMLDSIILPGRNNKINENNFHKLLMSRKHRHFLNALEKICRSQKVRG